MDEIDDIRQVEPPGRNEILRLWAGFLLPPLAWLLDLQVNYALAGWVCDTGRSWVLDVVTVVALFICVAGGALSWMSRRFIDEHAGAPERERTRLFVIAGIANALFFGLVIIATAIPNVILRSCP